MGKKKKEFDEIVEKSLWEIITARMCRAISRRYLIKKTRQKIPSQYEKIVEHYGELQGHNSHSLIALKILKFWKAKILEEQSFDQQT